MLISQFYQPIAAYAPAGGFSPTSTESGNFLARATGVTLDADKTNYDTMITGLVADGVFAKLDLLYIWAAPDRTTALLNLIQNAYNATEGGTVSFSAYHGYTGDASTFYLDPAFNPATASSPKFVQNSATVGVYNLSSRTTGHDWWAIGTTDDGGVSLLPYAVAGPQGSVFRLNATSAGFNGLLNNAQAAFSYTRTSSVLQSVFTNGTTTATNSTSDTSITPHNAGILFFSDTTGFGNTGDQMAAGWIGGGLTGTETAALHGRINTYLTAYGVNVY